MTLADAPSPSELVLERLVVTYSSLQNVYPDQWEAAVLAEAAIVAQDILTELAGAATVVLSTHRPMTLVGLATVLGARVEGQRRCAT